METSNPALLKLDAKLAALLKNLQKGGIDEKKQNKLQKSLKDITRDSVGEPKERIRSIVERFIEAGGIDSLKNSDEIFDYIKVLGEYPGEASATQMFHVWLEAHPEQEIDAILGIAPSATAIGLWLKTTKLTPKELRFDLLRRGEELFATAGLDWLMLCQRPDKQLIPVINCVLQEKRRPEWITQGGSVLAKALMKDKKGQLLGIILSHAWDNDKWIEAFASLMNSDSELMEHTVEMLPPIICKKNAPEQVVQFVELIFPSINSAEGEERERACALIARLCSGILLEPSKGKRADALLEILMKVTRQLRVTTSEKSQLSRTWIFENLSEGTELTDGRCHISFEGARHVALALEKEQKGLSSEDIIKALALNLGLEEFAVPGASVSYDPIKHEDVSGGLRPEDDVQVEMSGWRHNNEVVIRAKVSQ